MSYLSDLLDRARGVLGQPKPTGTETVAVRHDHYDSEEWREVRENSPAVQTVLAELGETFDYTEDLCEGVFNYFVKAEPEIVPDPEMQVSRRPNQKITVQGSETPEVVELRQYTRSDPYIAAMGVVGVAEKLRDYLQEHEELAEAAREAEKQRQEREQAEQDAADAATEAQACDNGYDGEGPPTEAEADAAAALQAALDALEQAQQAEADAGAQLDEQMSQNAPGTRTAVRQGIREATEEARDDAATMAACGVDPGEARHMPFEQREQLAQALSDTRLRELAKLIGRFRMEAAAERARRIEHGTDVFVDVEFGNDLARLLGSEIAKFAGPRPMRLDALVRFSERKMLQRRFEGTEKSGKGTIVAVVDTSGSMTMNIGGVEPADINIDPTREAWAKAITFVLLDSARRQRRDFYAILFSSAGQQRHYYFPAGGEPMVLEADGRTPIAVATPVPGNTELAVTLDLITFMFNGGTNFEQPLAQALSVIERRFDETGKAKADIAFITDDDGHVSPDFMSGYLRIKDKVGVRTFGFAVGCHAGNTLTSVSDNVRSLTDLASTDEVRDVFRTL